MTAQLDQLEARALVHRSPDPHDRRGIQVNLTRGGQKLVDQAVGTYLAGHERLLSALSSAERQQLDTLLRKLLVVLEGSNRETAAQATANGRAPRERTTASPRSAASRRRRRG